MNAGHRTTMTERRESMLSQHEPLLSFSNDILCLRDNAEVVVGVLTVVGHKTYPTASPSGRSLVLITWAKRRKSKSGGMVVWMWEITND